MVKDERLLMRMGACTSTRGFDYIVKAAELLRDDPGLMNAVMKGLIPRIAGSFGTTPSRVERCIRYTISTIYNGAGDIPPELVPDARSGRLTNKEFLVRFVKVSDAVSLG